MYKAALHRWGLTVATVRDNVSKDVKGTQSQDIGHSDPAFDYPAPQLNKRRGNLSGNVNGERLPPKTTWGMCLACVSYLRCVSSDLWWAPKTTSAPSHVPVVSCFFPCYRASANLPLQPPCPRAHLQLSKHVNCGGTPPEPCLRCFESNTECVYVGQWKQQPRAREGTEAKYDDHSGNQQRGEMQLLDQMLPNSMPVFGDSSVLDKSPYLSMPDDFVSYLFDQYPGGEGSLNGLTEEQQAKQLKMDQAAAQTQAQTRAQAQAKHLNVQQPGAGAAMPAAPTPGSATLNQPMQRPVPTPGVNPAVPQGPGSVAAALDPHFNHGYQPLLSTEDTVYLSNFLANLTPDQTQRYTRFSETPSEVLVQWREPQDVTRLNQIGKNDGLVPGARQRPVALGNDNDSSEATVQWMAARKERKERDEGHASTSPPSYQASGLFSRTSAAGGSQDEKEPLPPTPRGGPSPEDGDALAIGAGKAPDRQEPRGVDVLLSAPHETPAAPTLRPLVPLLSPLILPLEDPDDAHTPSQLTVSSITDPDVNEAWWLPQPHIFHGTRAASSVGSPRPATSVLKKADVTDELPFTDSGYASTRDPQRPDSDARPYGDCLLTAAGKELADDDVRTLYSDATSVAPGERLRYILELTDDICSKLRDTGGYVDLPMVRRTLPHLTKAFAIRLGLEEDSGVSQQAMYFIHRHHK